MRKSLTQNQIDYVIKEYGIEYYEKYLFEKFKQNIRSRIHQAFNHKRYKKTSRTHELLGCDWETLKEHLESQFTEGMTWENNSMTGWHIDHIIPFAIADTKDEIEILSYYKNLQPLWAFDNMSKHDKFE